LKLDSVVIPAPGTHDASVFWLHGLGADGHDFETIVPALRLPHDHGIRFVFPHAPLRRITVNNGMTMRGWYDVREMTLQRTEDAAGIEESSAWLDDEISREIAGERISRVRSAHASIMPPRRPRSSATRSSSLSVLARSKSAVA